MTFLNRKTLNISHCESHQKIINCFLCDYILNFSHCVAFGKRKRDVCTMYAKGMGRSVTKAFKRNHFKHCSCTLGQESQKSVHFIVKNSDPPDQYRIIHGCTFFWQVCC